MMELPRNQWTGDTARRIATRAIRLYVQQEILADISDAEIDALLANATRNKRRTIACMTDDRKADMQDTCKEIIVLASEFAMRWSGGRGDLFHKRMQDRPEITFTEALADLMSDVTVTYSDTKRARKAV